MVQRLLAPDTPHFHAVAYAMSARGGPWFPVPPELPFANIPIGESP